ncbi:protein Brevis radix-like 4 isoform X1 [Salvia hispanica]|uniref:protein Brevis radix-like 4 isoform X1 n=1 Tax=Salvia hispanica TaxID=49212 RepID=UPI0020096B95|nr:protein Brevis radix-like 4 isoform X1 [Salvia hispanica]
MLTCIARSKQSSKDASSAIDLTPPEKYNSNATPTKQSIRSLSSQIKDMALKASGAYRHCAPCAAQTAPHQSDSERFHRRAGRRQLEARLKGISSGEGTPASASGRRVDPVVFVEESERKEWVAQVEPGVLITFLSLPRGGNDLKQIKFSREMFNKWQAQRWWTENCEKVTELYNVQRLNRQAFPLPGDDMASKIESVEHSPVTPPAGRECPNGVGAMASSSSDSLEQHSVQSTVSGTAKTEASSMRASDADRSGEMSISNAANMETEWVEEDEPGVYITIRALPHGRRELRRVRFSREKFGETHARVWWEQNRARIHEQYL